MEFYENVNLLKRVFSCSGTAVVIQIQHTKKQITMEFGGIFIFSSARICSKKNNQKYANTVILVRCIGGGIGDG